MAGADTVFKVVLDRVHDARLITALGGDPETDGLSGISREHRAILIARILHGVELMLDPTRRAPDPLPSKPFTIEVRSRSTAGIAQLRAGLAMHRGAGRGYTLRQSLRAWFKFHDQEGAPVQEPKIGVAAPAAKKAEPLAAGPAKDTPQTFIGGLLRGISAEEVDEARDHHAREGQDENF